jgi:hypothetical protein
MMKHRLHNVVVAVALLVAACSSDEPVPTTPSAPLFELRGSIDNPKGIAIPNTAKLIALWQVYKGSPDYMYAFGFGSVSPDRTSFSFSLDQALPDIASNGEGSSPTASDYYRLGVAYLILVDDPSNKIPTNMMMSAEGPPEGVRIIGAVNNTGIIYRAGNDSLDGWLWTQSFPKGYSLGVGIVVDNARDYFAPTSEVSRTLLVDTVQGAFTFPDWH